LLNPAKTILASVLQIAFARSGQTLPKHTLAKNNKITVKPLADRVLVQRIEEAEEIKGGIIIPDSAKEKPQEAKVVALGTGAVDKDGKKIPFSVKVGDKVLIGKYAGSEVKLNDEIYLLLREEEVLAVIE
jgi:chaperonin GroES